VPFPGGKKHDFSAKFALPKVKTGHRTLNEVKNSAKKDDFSGRPTEKSTQKGRFHRYFGRFRVSIFFGENGALAKLFSKKMRTGSGGRQRRRFLRL
jgi:hypothetical protein